MWRIAVWSITYLTALGATQPAFDKAQPNPAVHSRTGPSTGVRRALVVRGAPLQRALARAAEKAPRASCLLRFFSRRLGEFLRSRRRGDDGAHGGGAEAPVLERLDARDRRAAG